MDGSDSRGDLLEVGWNDQPLGIAHMAGMVRRQFGLVSLTLLGAILAGSAYIVLSDPLYTASSSIYAELESGVGTEANSLVQLDTHVELIQSDRTTAAVIAELGLDEIFDPDPGLLRRTVVDVRRWLRLEAFDVFAEEDEESEILRSVKSGLDVARIGNTSIIDISYTSPSKELSVAVANAYASNYVNEVTERAALSAERRVRQLQERADEVRRRASAANESVQNLRFQNNFVVADAESLEAQIAELRQRLSLANAEEAAVRARLALVSQAVDLETLQTAALQTQEGVEIYNSLVTANGKLAQLRQRSAVSEATIAQLEASIAEMREALERELRRSRDALELELAVITARRASVMGELNEISRYGGNTAWAQLLQAEQEAEVYEGLYQGYLNDLENSYRQARGSDVRLISEALRPLNPSFPNYKVVLAIAVMFGLVAGGGIALYREWSRSAARASRR